MSAAGGARVDVEALRRAHPLVTTVERAGVRLRRSGGGRYVGCCPFHEDGTPSFTLYADQERWYCFGCHCGGDVLDFVGRLEGTDFLGSARLLGEAPAVPVAARPPAREPRARAEAARSPEELEAIEAAVAYYAGALAGAGAARSYLLQRGLAAPTWRERRIGFAAWGLGRALADRGVSRQAAEAAGLLHKRRELLLGRVVIPDLDGEGRARWLTARALGAQEPKYRDLRGRRPLFGLAAVRRSGARAVVVTEGPFDQALACSWGVHCVALLGSHASEAQVAALRSFGRVYLALDADRAGREETERLTELLGDRARRVRLPRRAGDVAALGERPGGERVLRRALAAAARGGTGPATGQRDERSGTRGGGAPSAAAREGGTR